MRFLAALAVIPALACASTSSASSGGGQMASAQACSDPQVAAVVAPGGELYARPDGTSKVLATVDTNTRVCADANPTGFDFRRIKLADGSVGYMRDSHVNVQ
jgi:hypothetical protein